jgi:hypothetical protein
MDYLLVIVLVVIAVPLLFVLLGRTPRGAGRLGGKRESGGVTPREPSSDQPTPQPDSVNRAEGVERKLPPG